MSEPAGLPGKDIAVSAQAEHELMRLVVEATPNALILVSREGRIAMVNAQAEKLFGYPRAELLAQPLEILVPERYRAAHSGQRSGFFADPQTRAMGAGRDLFGLRKDGSEIPIEIGLNPLVTGEGTLVLASIIDITERKRAEAELVRAHRQNKLILDAIGVGVHGIDREGKIIFENPASAALLGYAAEELIGKPAHTTMHHTRADGSPYPVGECHIYATLRDGVRRQIDDEVFWRKDGASFPVIYTSTPILDETGDIAGAVVVFRDLTARRRAEALFKQVVEAAPNGLVMLNASGLITLLNAQAERLFGYRREELIGQPIEMLVPERFRAMHPTHRNEFFANPEQRAMGAGRDLFGLRQDGSEVPIEIGLSPIVTDEGASVLASIIDITERKQAENALRAATERAQAADRLKSVFLAVMSHELRTPLNSIIGFTGIILQGLAGPLNAEQTKQLGMVQGSARHLLALINDVLDISKIEAGEITVIREPFDLRASIAKVAGIVQPLAEQKGLALHVEIAPGVGTLESDQRRVEQVLLNLLNNAVKFTDRGGVTLRSEVVAPPSGQAVSVQVIDTGSGIKPEDFEKLFKPFQQVNGGLSRPHEGTGLGLAICKRIISLLGGDISVRSVWGEGSTFEFLLPLTPAGQPGGSS